MKVIDSTLNDQIRCRIPREQMSSLRPWFLSVLLLFLNNNPDVKSFRTSRIVHSHHGHHLFSRSRVGGSRLDELEALVAKSVQVAQGPYLLETNDQHNLISVDTRVRWTCDNIVAIDGRENYRGLSRQWTETTMTELAESRYYASPTSQSLTFPVVKSLKYSSTTIFCTQSHS